MIKNKRKSNAAEQKYEPTAHERDALCNYYSRRAATTAPRLKVIAGKTTTILPDHPDPPVGWRLFMDAIGTSDVDFANGLIDQLANAGLKGEQINEDRINFLFSVVKDVKPKDHLVAMLVAQMAAVHVSFMAFAHQLPLAETLNEQDSIERALNKLGRTFTIQMETLKRYQSNGDPPVTVQKSIGK